MEKEKSCKNYINYSPYYIKSGARFLKAAYGECRLSKRRQLSLCCKWQPEPSGEIKKEEAKKSISHLLENILTSLGRFIILVENWDNTVF